MEINIRKAIIEDINSIAHVHYNSFHSANQDLRAADFLSKLSLASFAERWQQRLTADITSTLVAEVNNKIVGLVCFSLTPEQIPPQCDTSSAEILFLYIEPGYFRKGVSRLLSHAAADFIRQSGSKHIFGWAAFNNSNSKAFYKAIGATTGGMERKVPKLNTELHQVLYQANL